MQHRKLLLALLANFFIPLAGISTDIYLPSLPALAHDFSVGKAYVQLTVTSFVIGMGIMQLIAGPLSDAIGRKKLLVASALTQIIAIILVLYSPTMDWMIGFRFIQGSAAAFMIVPARAILNDSFEGDALKKQFNYATISFALGPILGPFIGGYLQHYFGWHANFIFILCYAVIALLLACFVYHETIAAKHRFSVTHLWHNYVTVVENRLFVVSTLFTACLFGYTAFFNVAGPFLIEVALKQTPITFGHMALLMGVAWFLGNVTNRLLFHMNKTRKAMIALVITAISALVMFVLSLCGYFTVSLVVVPLFFMIMMSGGIFSLFASECLSMFRKMAASANAFFFGMTWLSFAIFTLIAAATKAQSLVPISAALFGLSLFNFVMIAWVRRHED